MSRRTIVSLLMLLLLALTLPALAWLRPEGPVAGTLTFAALVGLFRLMGRFEQPHR